MSKDLSTFGHFHICEEQFGFAFPFWQFESANDVLLFLDLEQSGVENAHYYLLYLDTGAQKITVRGFKAKELHRASDEYLAIEKEIVDKPGTDAVLVSVESLASLRRAYPNYFLDTRVFIKAVNEALSG